MTNVVMTNNETVDGEERFCGAFTYQLAQQLNKAHAEQTTCADLMDALTGRRAKLGATPIFIGEPSAKPFYVVKDHVMCFFDFARGRRAELLSNKALLREYQSLQGQIPRLASAQVTFGRTFLAHGDEQHAKKAFQTALKYDQGNQAAALVLTAMEVRAGEIEAARTRLQQVAAMRDSLPPTISLTRPDSFRGVSRRRS